MLFSEHDLVKGDAGETIKISLLSFSIFNSPNVKPKLSVIIQYIQQQIYFYFNLKMRL